MAVAAQVSVVSFSAGPCRSSCVDKLQLLKYLFLGQAGLWRQEPPAAEQQTCLPWTPHAIEGVVCADSKMLLLMQQLLKLDLKTRVLCFFFFNLKFLAKFR